MTQKSWKPPRNLNRSSERASELHAPIFTQPQQNRSKLVTRPGLVTHAAENASRENHAREERDKCVASHTCGIGSKIGDVISAWRQCQRRRMSASQRNAPACVPICTCACLIIAASEFEVITPVPSPRREKGSTKEAWRRRRRDRYANITQTRVSTRARAFACKSVNICLVTWNSAEILGNRERGKKVKGQGSHVCLFAPFCHGLSSDIIYT